MNKIKREKKIPKEWLMRVVAPIYKKANSQECNNYGAITIESIVE